MEHLAGSLSARGEVLSRSVFTVQEIATDNYRPYRVTMCLMLTTYKTSYHTLILTVLLNKQKFPNPIFFMFEVYRI